MRDQFPCAFSFGRVERGDAMSKADFIENVAKKGLMSKAEAKRAVELVFGEIEAGIKALKNGGTFPIGKFGVFTVAKRGPRSGHNPRTGDVIKIKPRKQLRFKPSITLKKAAGV
jgi:DNA-binding protein HU-beta